MACGQHLPIDVPVVLWTDTGGFDATRAYKHFATSSAGGPQDGSLRYAPGRAERGEAGKVLVPPESGDLGQLASVIDLFVLHYDACGTSRRCFEVLHDLRGLSVHFLLDLDGTLYQTMDLRDQAWHAREANPRSIGIEIANIGAYPLGEGEVLEQWYKHDLEGTRLVVPAEAGAEHTYGQRILRPVRPQPLQGAIQGTTLAMYDLTREQYDTLVQLSAALCRYFPRIRPEAPRDRLGRVRTDALSPQEFAQFQGILGHFHVTSDKYDPGPAFNWEQFLSRLRTRLVVEN